MLKNRNRRRFLIYGVILAVFSAGCPNNLLDTIDEEVEIIVTPPSIESLFPDTDAANVDIGIDNIYITFTKGIDSDSVNSASLIIKNTANTEDRSDDTVVQGTYSVSNRTANFNPSTELKYMTTYSVTVTSMVRDVDGNNFPQEYIWEFTTKSTPSSVLPVISDFRIDYGRTATNQDTVRVDLQASNVEGETGDLEYRYRLSTGDWPEWTLLTDNAVSLTDVTLPLSGVSSETFNFEAQVRNESRYVSDLATALIEYDQVAPAVTVTSPEANSSDYPANSGVISLSFSEAIDPNSITLSTYDIDGLIETEGNFYLMKGDTRIEGEDLRYIETDPNEIYPNNTILLTGLELDQGGDYMVYLEESATDVAGNPIESEYSWFFRTGDAIDNEPPVGTVLLDTQNYSTDHPTATATNTTSLNLVISASDSYNDIYGMKIWGYNDGSLPLFEGDAVWEPYYDGNGDPYGSNANPYPWTLPGGDGFKYIYYKFMDTDSNETEEPERLKISLDTTAPVINNVSLNGEAEYTNNQEFSVELTVDANDVTSGISRMRISVDGNLDTEPEIEWIPTQTIILPAGDGVKTVEIEVIDNVDLTASGTDTIILDTTKPGIVFDLEDQLIINGTNAQTGSYTDANPISSYLWEQVSGPGVLTFSDTAAEAPDVSADTEGEYVLKVTVTDAAGNEAFGTVPLVWDVTAPGNTAGTAGNGPAPNVTASAYSSTNQPEWHWDDVSGRDYYKVSFADNPDWETPDATGQAGYIITEIASFAPAEGLSEGVKTLKVRAYDNAGNHTETGSAPVHIDTIFPVISNDGAFFTVNSQITIDNSAAATDQGTGIETRLWEQLSGTGVVTFGTPAASSTTVSADTDDTYTLSLTVTDYAGNETIAYYTLEWDTTAPAVPQIAGLTHTPSTTPSWNWSSGGGGNGIYRYRLDRRARNWESNGGAYTAETVVVFDWQAETGNTSYMGISIEDMYEYTLYVQERDEAGNWSAESSHAIWIDSDYTSEPNLIRDGDYLRNVNSVTWSWESGAGVDTASDYYRYSTDGSNWTVTANNSITLSSLSDGITTFQIEERINGTDWVDKIASSSVQIDTAAPNSPTVSMTQTGTSDIVTNDTTPTLTWSSGGGGMGVYMYRFYNGSGWSSWSDETTATSYTHTTALGDTVSASLEVMERDLAGNWSAAGTRTITIDTTLPVPGAISINSGAAYATSTSVTLTVSATGADQMQFANYSSLYGWGTWSSWENYSTGKSFTLTSSDETKYALVKFRDEAGNVSGYIYDIIVLDTTPPSFSSFTINSNATSTGSTSVTLNSSVSGATTMYLRNGTSGGFTAYSYSDSRSWTLTSGYGTKAVQVYFADAAGNTTYSSVSPRTDLIHYGNTTLYNSTKGETSNGYVTLNYNSYGTEYGTNTYYAYFHTSPTSNPSVGAVATGSSTSTAPTYYTGNVTGAISEGTVYYVYIRMYNSNAGWSDRYSNYIISFSSDITVVYNSSDTDDTSIASKIKSLFENESLTTTYSSYISGSEPVWTVTMLPQNLITNSWTTLDDRYIIYGDPVIITPGAYYTYNTPNVARNIAHRSYNTGLSPTTTNYRSAVIAMGYSGARFLQLLENNPSWHYSGTLNYQTQYPTEIGAGHVMYTTSADVSMLQWTASTNVWSYPLTSTLFSGGTTPVHGATTQLSYTALGGSGNSYDYRAMVYRGTDTNPANGYLLCGDTAYAHYFPIVQQGRFLQYGFPVLADRPYTGKVLFKNLVYRMYAGFY